MAVEPVTTGEPVNHIARYHAGEIVVHYPAVVASDDDPYPVLYSPTY